MADTQTLVRRFFSAKAAQLRACAELPICEHPGLIGGHREELQRIYLREILPRRFGVGRGMVYGPFGKRSKESDIVIWDVQNYPSLPLLDHSFYFAESVKLVAECKSVFSTSEMTDIKAKCGAIRDIHTLHEPSLAEAVKMLQQDVYALMNGLTHQGALIVPRHIATAAIFLQGGATLTAESIPSEDLAFAIDHDWPDITLLLDPGRVFVKNYDDLPESGPTLDVYDAGEHALLIFTNAFLELLSERAIQTESPLHLLYYGDIKSEFKPTASIPFSILDFPAGRIPLWE